MKFSRSCLAVLLFAALGTNAQDATTTTTAASTTTTTAETTAAPPETGSTGAEDVTPAASRVISVSGRPDRKGRKLRLRDEVRIAVRGYGALHEAAAARQKPITLWINGIDSELAASGIEPYTDKASKMTQAEREDARMLTFFLTRTTENADLWREVLRDPFGEPETDLALSAGVSGGAPLLLDPNVIGTLKLEKTFFTWPGTFWALLVLVVIVGLFRYRSDMLRNGPDIDGRKQAYSLGRSQMAWWFILIIASYITIWLITGDRDTITASLLVLMGISAATAMGSIAIDAAAPGRANDARQELEAEKATLKASPTMAVAKSGASTAEEQAAGEAMRLRVAEIDQTVAGVTKPSLTTGSWLRDVLTDNNGVVALHRFQVLVWTIVLGFIFLTSVVRDLSMPEFSTTLLALMGISAGTYLGFKLPANGG